MKKAFVMNIPQRLILVILAAFLAMCLHAPARAQVAGRSGTDDLVIAQNERTEATIVAVANPGTWEGRAVADLQKYIGLMSGAQPRITNAIPGASAPVLLVGQAALQAEPALLNALDGVVKKNPAVRADAVVVRRTGNRIYLAGTNDESHYFAVSWLLQHWGCRWYLPTDFGEAIPEHSVLKAGTLNFTYAPPFEIRHYWLSWNGDRTGSDEFRRRNFMTETSMVGMGHALGKYTKDFVPPGKTIFDIDFSDPNTAQHIAAKIESDYAAGKDISLAIEDGLYSSKAMVVEYDKYMLTPSLTDAMMTLYNNVGKILREKHPGSKAKIGGMAYGNVTLPPKRVKRVEPNVVMWIAPIDIDPNHGMDDPKSPPRHEYKAMMYRWAELLSGRLAIYDYDQGMLIWRDMPNPSQHAFAQDVKHYAKAGILGIGTESRGATATTFLNLFFRGQLMWDPKSDVEGLLAEFYPKFYGPAAAPAAKYWDAIFAAWRNTIITEHEYMAAPAIYTPQLIAELQRNLEEAEAQIKPLYGKAGLNRNEKLYLDRMRFTRLSFEIIQNYIGMVTRASRDNDYKAAAASGERALAAREMLTDMNPTFTTYKVIGESGPAWFPGEVQHMRELAALTDGTKGTTLLQMPLTWAFRRGASLPANWTYKGPEGGAPDDGALATQAPTTTNGWSALRTDLYLQAQGVLNPDGQSYTGYYWCQTAVDLSADKTKGEVHLMFPGLFNEIWLYVNGEMVAHRSYTEPSWRSDYKYEWDVNISGKLRPGNNTIAVRGFNPHHFGGIFRRPFLYRRSG
jgi:hypothetical protein